MVLVFAARLMLLLLLLFMMMEVVNLMLLRLMQMGMMMDLLEDLWKQLLRRKMLLKVESFPLELVVLNEEVHRLFIVSQGNDGGQRRFSLHLRLNFPTFFFFVRF